MPYTHTHPNIRAGRIEDDAAATHTYTHNHTLAYEYTLSSIFFSPTFAISISLLVGVCVRVLCDPYWRKYQLVSLKHFKNWRLQILAISTATPNVFAANDWVSDRLNKECVSLFLSPNVLWSIDLVSCLCFSKFSIKNNLKPAPLNRWVNHTHKCFGAKSHATFKTHQRSYLDFPRRFQGKTQRKIARK